MAMMIQKFHRLIQSKVLWMAFLILVCFAFVGLYLPGQRSYDRSVKASAPGELDGKPVPQDEYLHHRLGAFLAATLVNLRPPPNTPEVNQRLEDLAWRRLISIRTAKEMGITAGDDEVVSTIKQNPIFNQGERFNQAQYSMFVERFLGGLGLTERQYEEHIREELILGKLRMGVGQSALVPPDELKRRFRLVRDEFVVDYAVLTKQLVEDDVTVTPDEAKAYFDEDPEPYRVPEKVQVSMVQFDVDDFMDDIHDVTTEDAQAYYDANEDQFAYLAPQEVDPKEEAVDESETVEPAEEALDKPAADAEDEAADVDEVENTEDQAAEVDEAEEQEAEPPPSPPLQRVVQPFEEAQDEIIDQLRRRAARRLAAEKATDFVVTIAPDRRGNAPSFAEAAAELDLDIIELSPFTENEPLPGLGVGPQFNSAAFALEDEPDHYFSDAVIGEDAVYVLKLNKRIPSRIPAFEEVEQEATEAAREHAVAAALAEKAAEIHDAAESALAGGKTLAEALEPFGLESTRTDAFSQMTGTDALPHSNVVLPGIRYLNAGELTTPLGAGDDLMLAYVVSRKEGDPTEFSTLKTQIQNSLRQRQASILFEEWENYLLREANFQDRKQLQRGKQDSEPEPDDDATAG